MHFGEVCFAFSRVVRIRRSESRNRGLHDSAWIGSGAVAEDPRTAGTAHLGASIRRHHDGYDTGNGGFAIQIRCSICKDWRTRSALIVGRLRRRGKRLQAHCRQPIQKDGVLLVDSGRQRPARRQMLPRKHALARLPRLEGLSRCSRLTKNMKRALCYLLPESLRAIPF